ncbi:ATP-binding cassette domain-containing protein [Nonomuraea sp. NPDC050404]|uniref:ATP-binding cassette domain-containing protein n=1 Tax=Nonomuraea sp. NPDC050404 TaxID=3155783 RepID=UPI0033E05201
MALRLRELCAGYPARRGRPERRVLEGLDAEAAPGELTVLIGPNGTGKSTLLRTMAALQPALSGAVLIGDRPVASVPAADLARRLAVVLTERDLPPLLSAREVAGLGRHPHTGFSGRLSPADHEIVTWALTAVQAGHLAGRQVTELSDGERQRVLVARALAQEPSVILLDEPTAFLDVTSRVALMGLLRRLARQRDLVIVASTHDLELALRVADRVWLLEPGGGLRAGTPEELTLTGAIGTTFDGDELSFDAAGGVFTLHPGGTGTVSVTAGGLHRPLLERALAREGWHSGGAEPVLSVRHTGEAYEAAYDGARSRLDTLPEVAAFARAAARSAKPPGLLPADEDTLAAAVAGVSAIGGYFELTPPSAGEPDDSGWRPLPDLLTGSRTLADKIDEVAERLATRERRVAASILFQGLAARLWSPPAGVFVEHGLLLDLPAGDLRWRPAPTGPLPLRAARLTGWHVRAPDRIPAMLYRRVVTEQLEPLATTITGIVKLAPGLLWGNAASALAGTVRAMARQRPAQAAAAIELGRDLLRIGRLRGTGELAEPAPGHPFFVRRSCCLYYRLPDGGKCGDCALIPDQARRDQWARAIGETS